MLISANQITTRMTPVKKKVKGEDLLKEVRRLAKSLSKYTSKVDSTTFIRRMRDSRK